MIITASEVVPVPDAPSADAPVVLRGAAAGWTAARRWSFDFLRKRLGTNPVVLSDDVGRPQAHLKTSFARYADYVLGRCALDPPPDGDAPWYLGNWNAFDAAPELAEDFESPEGVEDRLSGWSPTDRRWHHGRFGWLFVGPAGTRSFPHRDIFATHAWIAQLVGRKHVRLIEGEQALAARRAGHDREVGWAWDAILEPGDILLIPSNMLHEAVALEPSISLSFNYVDARNQAAVIDAIRANPALWAAKTAGADVRLPA